MTETKKPKSLIDEIAESETVSKAQAEIFAKSMKINTGPLRSDEHDGGWLRKLIRRRMLGELGINSSNDKDDITG